jgi:hypothetical protein
VSVGRLLESVILGVGCVVEEHLSWITLAGLCLQNMQKHDFINTTSNMVLFQLD